MYKLLTFLSALILFIGCKSTSTSVQNEEDREVSNNKHKDYIGEELSVLNDDFNVESCELKFAYFKDVYAVKFVLKNEQEIIVILKNKLELSKTEMEQGCSSNKINSGVISKIKFYKNGEETNLDGISNN